MERASEGTEYGAVDKNQECNEAIKGSEGQWCTERLGACEDWEDWKDGDFGILSTQADGTLVSLH